MFSVSFKLHSYYNINYYFLKRYMTTKELLKLTGIPVLLASMCCLSPLIFLWLWVISLSAATELTDVFYGTYKWLFRGIGLLALAFTLWYYFRTKGICTLDQAKRHRNKIISTTIVTLTGAILGYMFFLYVVVHYIGVWLEVWK